MNLRQMLALLAAVFLAAGGLAIASSANAAPRLVSRPGLEVVQASELPPPDPQDLTGRERLYLVGPFDRLTIDVFGVAELSQREVQVDGAGNISFPLAGTVAVAGKAPDEVATLIAERLAREYLRDPQVTVNLKSTGNQILTVEGEVKKPGLYPVMGRMTLLRAMALAGGPSDLARLKDVVIFRDVKGERYAALYDLNAIRRGLYGDPEVFANDTVVVGDSKARRLFKDILTLTPLLTAPLIVLTRP